MDREKVIKSVCLRKTERGWGGDGSERDRERERD